MKIIEHLVGDNGLEVILSQSACGGEPVAVTIFASSPEAIAAVVWELFKKYGADEFTQPELCDDGKWGTFGRL